MQLSLRFVFVTYHIVLHVPQSSSAVVGLSRRIGRRGRVYDWVVSRVEEGEMEKISQDICPRPFP